jgi:hypothetical protein
VQFLIDLLLFGCVGCQEESNDGAEETFKSNTSTSTANPIPNDVDHYPRIIMDRLQPHSGLVMQTALPEA